MRKAVREEIKHGSDWIKLLCSGAFMSSHDSPSDCHFSKEEIIMAVNEAAMRKIPVCAHAHSILSIKLAVEAGVKSIEHGTFLAEDVNVISLMKEKGTYLVPTLFVSDYYISKGSSDGSQLKMVQLSKKFRDIHFKGVNLAYKAGIKIICGTDNVGWHPSLNINELLLLQEAGLHTIDILNSATLSAAELLGINNIVGDINPGYYADLIIIKSSPFDNLSILKEPFQAVLLAGFLS